MSNNSRKKDKKKKIMKRRGASINREKPRIIKIKTNNIKVKPRENKRTGFSGITPNKKIVVPKNDEIISNKKRTLNNRLNSLEHRIKNIPQRIISIDNSIQKMPNRISEIRNNNYHSQSTLEKESEILKQNWSQVSNNIRNFSDQQIYSLLNGKSEVETKLNTTNSSSGLELLENQLTQYSQNINLFENSVNSQLREHQDRYNTINNNLKIAENTLKHLTNSSIEWKINETPILAVETQDLNNDKTGIIVLTNLRFLFEEIKEVVIRKTFFIVTEKKTVKEVILEQPIGSIDEINKGNVGFLKGAGLYIKFKTQTGLPELKLDTSNNDDEKVIHFYNRIISGEAEKELSQEQTDGLTESQEPLNCHNCSAPIKEEIMRGQTSIKCIYCGTVIRV